jgi:hypothetical protein
MSNPNNGQLRPYGYRPGRELGWCAACSRPFKDAHEDAFKCRKCAAEQWEKVEGECNKAGVITE